MGGTAGRPGMGDLPAEMTSFIGRRTELADVATLLSQSRLVTLTGAGGSGKTRLALRLAAESALPDGVCWVQLSGLQDADLLPCAVAERLRLADQSSRPQIDVLADFLAGKELLLVLDTCEHLVDACAMLCDVLLRASPSLRILATSRERLSVRGEHAFLVPPLPVPDPDAQGTRPAADGSYDAMNLYADRAALVDATFRLDERTWPAVARLCRRLDGLPLAIELAAGWASALSAEHLTARMDDRFRLLQGGTDAALPRHETLRTAIGWSHELCTPRQRLLWARISVFPAEFDLEAAEQVCGDARLPVPEIAALLATLVSKSILLSRPTPTGPRFRQLDTLREYGRSWLVLLNAEHTLLIRHRDYYLDLAERFDDGWRGPDQVAWLDRAQRELPNLRAAMEFCLSAPSQAQAALTMAGSLFFFWLAHAPREGGLHLDRALQAPPRPTSERARALWGRSWLSIVLGDPDGAAAQAAQGVALAEQIDDPQAVAFSVFCAGAHQALWGDAGESLALLRRAADLHRRAGDDVIGLPFSLILLSTALLRLGRPEAAISSLDAARSMCQRSGEEWLSSYCDFYQVNPELAIGDHASATRHALAALRTKVRMRDPLGQLLAIDALAGATAAAGDVERAARLLGIAQRLAESTGIGYARLEAIRSTAEVQARSKLGEAAFRSALHEGRGLSPEDALAYAQEP